MPAKRAAPHAEIVRFRAEAGLSRAIAEAASTAGVSPSEYLRRAVRAHLTLAGVALPPPERRRQTPLRARTVH